MSFYIGKKNALYHKRPNGSLSRFGIRLSKERVQVFDHLRREWLELPMIIDDRSGGFIRIIIDDTNRIPEESSH